MNEENYQNQTKKLKNAIKTKEQKRHSRMKSALNENELFRFECEQKQHSKV